MKHLAAVLLFCLAAPAVAQRPLAPEVEAFIVEVAERHGFDREALRQTFSQLRPRLAVLRAIMNPGTARPWHEFRARFVDPARVQAGVRFWREHAPTLARASREFGVPEEIIVATIGIETMFGRHIGSFRVLEALATLAFHYPPRAQLFRNELEEFLLLAREARFDAAAARGSYAGALGIPQFLPSSYRRFALDYDGDGRRDLWGSVQDAIGSVANYYRAHGWRPGAPVAVAAEVGSSEVDALVAAGIRPHLKVAELKRLGVVPLAPVDAALEAALIMAETESGQRHWLAFNNFYVITRYNRSVNYALAVQELARELRALAGPAN
jgi:membrane-bound lytic murein transglycosylase B